MDINTITKVEAAGLSIEINPKEDKALLIVKDESSEEWNGSFIARELAEVIVAGLTAAAKKIK